MNKLSLALAMAAAPLAGEAGAAASDFLLSDGAQRYAVYAGATRLHFGDPVDRLHLIDPLTPLLNERGKRFLSSAEFDKKMGRAVGILSIGVLRETGSAAGTQDSLALARHTRPTTTFTSLSLGYMLSPHSSLMAMASYGKTEGIGSPDSLLAQVSSVRTVAFSAGYARRELFASNDRLALTWSMPTKVRAGSLENSGLAVQAGDVNALGFGAPVLNLRPTATERDLELGYTRVFGRRGKLTGAVMLRVNPGHDAIARPDWLTGVRYSYGF
ncbi:hypothetical protein [Duganella aceris]|uniref:Transporter n=1 Tax=Duganella aceris TaxID=2703883 RepID=A0ABX0FSR1_9BURK|nr:hypothetical protein [Duganella aceris]NGZ87723.1 hypothetical protein [Duganella aceris]